MEPDANQLVERACRGDRTAAADLIELFYERIYAFLRRLAASRKGWRVERFTQAP